MGQGLFSLGIYKTNYLTALFGRALYGLGGESLNVSQFETINKWFDSKQLSLSLSIIASIDRLSVAVNDNTIPFIADSTSLSFSLFLGFLICGVSLFSGILMYFADDLKEKNKKNAIKASEIFKEIKMFGLDFWVTCVNCALVNADVYCFNNVASGYFQDRFGYNNIEAGRIISITFVISGVLCPFIGLLLDKIGRRIYFIMFSAVSITLSHVFLVCTPSSHRPILPIFAIAILGMGFSVYTSVIWSTVPYLIDNKNSATGFGFMTSFYNFALVIFPIFVGIIIDNCEGYFWLSFLFICIGICGIASTVWLYYANKSRGGSLLRANQGKWNKNIESSSKAPEDLSMN
jgi:nitrate/nitrite transporter NarK